METNYVSYCRVSTKGQEISGLGLSSQREIIRNYVKGKGRLVKEFVEQESGKNDNRIELAKAIVTAKENDATLLISKLDRLSRSVSFISQLMDAKIKFVCCDMPEANEFTIHIFAALAQQERKMISERTKNALLAKKLREPDWKAGSPKNFTDASRKKGHATIASNARNTTSIVHARHYITLLVESGHTYQYIADMLNKEGYKTYRGCMFHAQQVYNIWQRYMNEVVTKKAGQDQIDIV